MVVIAIALQHRLAEAATRELGPRGDAILADVTQRFLNTRLESLVYDQLPQLLAMVEREMAAIAGRAGAAALAEELERVRQHADLDLGARLVAALERSLGAMAAPFLATVCAKLELSVDAIHRGMLPRLTSLIESEARPFVGAEAAALLGAAVEQARRRRPPGLVSLVLEIAEQYAGADGERICRDLCQTHLSFDLDDLDIERLPALARTVEEHAAPLIGGSRTAAFLAAARQAIVEPGNPLRARVIDLAGRQFGPAAGVFVRRVVERNGVPFDAVSYEHLHWLAEVLRREAAALAGDAEANELARQVSLLLPEPAPAAPQPPATPTQPRRRFGNPLKDLRNAARTRLRASG
jgi:hypothetical protein